jgi:hypothetical protein
MLISSRKNKGHLLEKLVRDKLKELFQFSDDDIRTTISSETGADIKLSKKALLIFPFKVECKNRTKIMIYNWYNQCIGHKGEEEPLLIIKQNRHKPLAVLDFEYFLKLIKKE